MTRLKGVLQLTFLLTSFCLNGRPTHAADASPLCFDFSKPHSTPLRPEPSVYPGRGNEVIDKGQKEDPNFKERIAWASLQGTIPSPLSEVVKRLQDPMTTRNPATTRVKATALPLPGALLKQNVQVTVKPIFFLTLEWEEDWMFVALDGPPADPKKVLVSYQKTAGTSHIRRFCGTILLSRLGPELTGISHTEEIIADRREPGDVANGMMGTLRTLRK